MNDLHRERYRLLIEWLGDHYGRPRYGWQAKVARDLGVNRSTVNRIERGLGVIGERGVRKAVDRGLQWSFFTGASPDKAFADFMQARFRCEGCVHRDRVIDELRARVRTLEEGTRWGHGQTFTRGAGNTPNGWDRSHTTVTRRA